jgi:hypothetical protein
MKQVLREDIQLGGGDFRRILDGIPHIRMTWEDKAAGHHFAE